jgi:hypothetical protein
MIGPAPTLVPVRRPLTDKERRALRAAIGRLTANKRRASTAYLPIGAGVIFLLWLWTILASDAPWLVVTAFWLAIGGAIILWVRRDMVSHVKQLTAMTEGLESAIRRSEADVYDIRSTAFAVLEEIEDEGACYAFGLDGNRLVFVAGQEFYEASRFPSLDFALVYPLDERGRAVEMWIEKRGEKAKPARTISAAAKQKLRVPEHLEVHIGRIEDIDRVLGEDIQP